MVMQGVSAGGSEPDHFMEIWTYNLEEGFDKIRQIVRKYPYIAMVRHKVEVSVKGRNG